MTKHIRQIISAFILTISGAALITLGPMTYAEGKHATGIIFIVCAVSFIAQGILKLWKFKMAKKDAGD